MVTDRFKDRDWVMNVVAGGRIESWQQVQVAVMMDIRDELKINNAELKQLNALLHCSNFVRIPHTLKTIDKRLAKKVPLR